ncbi:hypothetical protein OsI_31136 [Oryza sativa Indica Group]|jgi:hypothetical protein|uniref:Uncharacterized protein n=1 Tax=Oryza sativa subsp. indica TaxID=39946 RepID=B8BEY5_ORYSI|nr:hypothetical protein OsI_31136 [Oryza sativa Indica Group]
MRRAVHLHQDAPLEVVNGGGRRIVAAAAQSGSSIAVLITMAGGGRKTDAEATKIQQLTVVSTAGGRGRRREEDHDHRRGCTNPATQPREAVTTHTVVVAGRHAARRRAEVHAVVGAGGAGEGAGLVVLGVAVADL